VTALWWTEADSAELAVLIAELALRGAEHKARCPTCQALADSHCAGRESIARERAAYDYAPLSGPKGFYAGVRRRLAEHDAACRTCRLAKSARCAALEEAIKVVIEWRWKRGLLSRAQYLRRKEEAA
jgi:hypothetical protein